VRLVRFRRAPPPAIAQKVPGSSPSPLRLHHLPPLAQSPLERLNSLLAHVVCFALNTRVVGVGGPSHTLFINNPLASLTFISSVYFVPLPLLRRLVSSKLLRPESIYIICWIFRTPFFHTDPKWLPPRLSNLSASPAPIATRRSPTSMIRMSATMHTFQDTP